MVRKSFVSISLTIILLLSLASNAFAATENTTMYYNGTSIGVSQAWSEIQKLSDNTVAAKAWTKVYADYGGYIGKSTTTVSASKNGFFAGSTDHTSSTAGGTSVVLLGLGFYSATTSYTSTSTHYHLNIDGVKTGYNTIENSGISF